jgi:hypothetical protein
MNNPSPSACGGNGKPPIHWTLMTSPVVGCLTVKL